MLIIVTAPICPACDKAKRYLHEKGIKFRSVHFESAEGQKLSEKYNCYAAPLIVDPVHDKAITGFSQKQIDEMIRGLAS